jgi:hypothetical protein
MCSRAATNVSVVESGDARLVEVADVLAPHHVLAADALGRREHLGLLVLQEVGLGPTGGSIASRATTCSRWFCTTSRSAPTES